MCKQEGIIIDMERREFFMIKKIITLEGINDVKKFVNVVSKYEFDVDLLSGRYAVDAKSIMGIFSLDLTKPIEMEIHAEEDDESAQNFLEEIKDYI